MKIEIPQGLVIREAARAAAWESGYRRALGEAEGWAAFGSTTAHGRIFLAAAGPQRPCLLALEHPGAIAALGLASADLPGPGLARFLISDWGALLEVLERVYELSLDPPSALALFQAETKTIPKTTEAERLVVQRIGQDLFRKTLMAIWGGRCPLTGISDAALLRASHIIPWSECAGDAERLDPSNGLLLSALWDAAFDRALVSFDDQGAPLFAAALGEAARKALIWEAPIPLTDAHRLRLARHRERFEALSQAPSEAGEAGISS